MANAQIVLTAVDKTAAAFNSVRGRLDSLGQSFSAFSSSLTGQILGVAAAYEALHAISDVGKAVYDNTVAWQGWQYTLEGGGLTTQQTQAQLKFLSDTAMELGVNITDMGSSFSRFVLTGSTLGMSLSEMDADFKSVTEAMRIFHLGGQQAQRSWLALTEIMAMGKVQSRQFTQQLGRDWPGIGPLIAQALFPGADSMKRFYAAMDKGKISAQQFMDAFQRVMATPAMQGALGGALDSIQASAARVKDAWFGLTNEADNTQALSAASDAMNNLAHTLASPDFKKGFDEIVTGAAKGADALAKLLGPLMKLNDYAKSVMKNFGPLGMISDLGAKAKEIVKSRMAAQMNDLHNQMFEAQEILNVMADNGEKGTDAYREQADALAALTARYKELQQNFKVATPPPGAAPSSVSGLLAAPTAHVDAAVKKSRDALQKFIESEAESASTMDLGAEATMRYKIAHGQLHDELAKLPPAVRKEDEALLLNLATVKDLTKAIKDMRPVTDEGVKSVKDFGAAAKQSGDLVAEFSKEAARNIEDSFAKMFEHTGSSWRAWARGLVDSLRSALANLLSETILTKLFSGAYGSSGTGNDGLAAIFAHMLGSARAAGGPVEGGKISLVGEAGPELFMPSSSGTIIPNSALRSAGAHYNTNIQIDARGAGPETAAKLMAMRLEWMAEMRGETEYRLRRNAWMTT